MRTVGGIATAAAASAAVLLATPLAVAAPVPIGPESAVNAAQTTDTTTSETVPDTAVTGQDPAAPSAPDPAETPSDPNAVAVVTATVGGGLEVHQVPAADPATKAAELATRPNVVAASPVRTRAILNAPDTDGAGRDMQWALNHLGAEDAWRTSSGAGVTVAVIDTGVDASHPDLAGRVVSGYDAIRNRSNAGNTDPHGHGTHVAGTIVAHGAATGIAPNARVMPVRVMDAQGFGTTTDIINGIIWATKHGANVINMSLGSTQPDNAEYTAIKWARTQGVMVVAATGNDGSTEPLYPAAYGDYKSNAAPGTDPVIGVGAVDRNSVHGWFSQRGNPVDVSAPGVRVFSTYPRSLGSYAWESGTSMASPYVAGVAAVGLSYVHAKHPELSDQAAATLVSAAIRDSATDLGKRGTDADYGRGEVTAVGTLAKLGAPGRAGMVRSLALIGRPGGNAVLNLRVPKGATFVARLTSAGGAGGAAGAPNSSTGTSVWSGLGTGTPQSKTLTGLSSSRSYTVTVFIRKGSAASRTIAGLRPVQWSIAHPRTILVGAHKKLVIGTRLPGYGIVPSGRITVTYRWSGHSKKRHGLPLSSELVALPIPATTGNLKFKASIDGGYGYWPSTSKIHRVSYHW